GMCSLIWYASRGRSTWQLSRFGCACEKTKMPPIDASTRESSKTKHTGINQNRPTIIIIQDVDLDTRAATLGRCEQCLERGKEAASHSIWAARLVSAQDPEDHRCPPGNRR